MGLVIQGQNSGFTILIQVVCTPYVDLL